MATITAIGGGTILGTGIAGASTDSKASLVDDIATTFNLDKSAVQNVFDEHHAERQANREAKMEERLQALVEEGSLTAEQKTYLEANRTSMKALIDELRSSGATREEIRAAHEANREELKAWATEQNLELGKVMPMRGVGHHGPHGPEMDKTDN